MAGPEIRAASPTDADGIATVYGPYVTASTTSFEDVAPDGDELRRRMLDPPRLPWYVATRDGTVAGYAYASRHRARAAYRWSVECSVYLAEHEQGQGTGRALYEALFADLRELGYMSAFAGITLPNEPSVRFHEAMGFTPIGVFRRVGYKHGAWWDVGWFQLALQEGQAAPDEPRAWR